MTTLTAWQKLILYLADADDSKVNELFTPLEKEMQENHVVSLTEEQFEILKPNATYILPAKANRIPGGKPPTS